LRDGRTIRYDILINTMPLDLLVQKTDLPDLFAYAEKLHHNSVTIIGLGIRLPIPELLKKNAWMYFPENNSPFYRATLFSNYSPHNAQAGCWSLMLEISDSKYKPVIPQELLAESIKGCVATGLIEKESDIVNQWQWRTEYGYPIPNHGRDETLQILIPALESKHIFSRGRFGAWKYEVGNMDHSYMQGVEVVDKILLGSEEITLGNPDKINGEGVTPMNRRQMG
jgi:protoporphyrinogen oxidase